ncbi:hypothetical protein QBC32DRAFT_317473 [Pseudoneurospora amorphoporcata]|uniref:Uncharacterized protein n=1 Tax=Pseudoneurospora amorphoporcata TaxID=241081 RepID=A0AAN6SCP4_9PEZI|nr:hypothetical protein QBC32DRAFT_317473 [Pseudoneurospora amorphoporcata]
MSQPNTPAMSDCYDHLRSALEAYKDDPLVEPFLSGSPDIIFDEDGDLLLTVGDEHDSRNFLIRSCLLRRHSSRFDSELRRLHLEEWLSNDPIKIRIHYDDQSSSSPLRKALEHWLASAAARLANEDLASKWTLVKCAYFSGDHVSFTKRSLELVRRHKGSFWNLEAQQGALLGQAEGLTTYLHVTGGSPLMQVLAELAHLRREFCTRLNDLYFGDIYDISAQPTLIDIDESTETEPGNESPASSTKSSTSTSLVKQCTCAWLPTYYNSWLELVDSRLPFPLELSKSYSLDMAYLPFRNFLLESHGEDVVRRPWHNCPVDKQPKECEMSPQEHHSAGEDLRIALAKLWAGWGIELKTAVMAWGEKRMLALEWKPWTAVEDNEPEQDNEREE